MQPQIYTDKKAGKRRIFCRVKMVKKAGGASKVAGGARKEAGKENDVNKCNAATCAHHSFTTKEISQFRTSLLAW